MLLRHFPVPRFSIISSRSWTSSFMRYGRQRSILSSSWNFIFVVFKIFFYASLILPSYQFRLDSFTASVRLFCSLVRENVSSHLCLLFSSSRILFCCCFFFCVNPPSPSTVAVNCSLSPTHHCTFSSLLPILVADCVSQPLLLLCACFCCSLSLSPNDPLQPPHCDSNCSFANGCFLLLPYHSGVSANPRRSLSSVSPSATVKRTSSSRVWYVLPWLHATLLHGGVLFRWVSRVPRLSVSSSSPSSLLTSTSCSP